MDAQKVVSFANAAQRPQMRSADEKWEIRDCSPVCRFRLSELLGLRLVELGDVVASLLQRRLLLRLHIRCNGSLGAFRRYATADLCFLFPFLQDNCPLLLPDAGNEAKRRVEHETSLRDRRD